MIVESGVETTISSYLDTSINLKLSKAESSVRGWPFNSLIGSLKLKINVSLYDTLLLSFVIFEL